MRPLDERAVLSVVEAAVRGDAPDPETLAAALPDLPERLLPLVARAALAAAGTLDEDTVSVLRDHLRRAAMTQMVRVRVVHRLQTGLRDAGIEALFLKGTALAEQVYPDPALRPMDDIDVWVRGEDMPRVVASVEPFEFVVPERYRDGAPHHGGVDNIPLEASFGRARLYIEVHSPPYSLSGLSEERARAIWGRSVRLPSGIRVMAPADQMLHLCLHVTRKTPFSGALPSLVDIALLAPLVCAEDGWGDVVGAAEEIRRTASVWSVLRLADDLLDAGVPPETLAALEPGRSKPILTAAREQLWAPSHRLPAGVEALMGGTTSGAGWLVRRTVGWHRRKGRSLESGHREGVVKGIARDVAVQLGRYADRFAQGVFFRRAFWASAVWARKRGRLLRLLEGEDRAGDPPP